MAVERIYDEIKKLSPMDRYKLRIMLETDEISEDDIEASKRAAGGWADIDAEKMIEDIYRSRDNNPDRIGVDW
ncbi:hypothetical protein [Desulfoscipio geothermicus]|uniref:Uncharacterized protein n=1 Tax=Desulfoscipio geothermicus DSM 3669 TaxID=1121426 RepID=A0A1I6E3W8_9FIRM|nr:hypothetical protein [Desulfoscipio geothermicus]SFR12435.1 hypothetical protein SAMN05660706_12527 [Desulfoscipio geothermicus DSM 3669]